MDGDGGSRILWSGWGGKSSSRRHLRLRWKRVPTERSPSGKELRLCVYTGDDEQAEQKAELKAEKKNRSAEQSSAASRAENRKQKRWLQGLGRRVSAKRIQLMIWGVAWSRAGGLVREDGKVG